MDLCDPYSVNGQRSLFVTGVEDTYTNEEIEQLFSTNGDISRIVRIPDDVNNPHGRVLIEYSTENSITKINPIVLGEIASPNDPSETWHVKTIRSLYEEEAGKKLAQQYLRELRAVAGANTGGFLKALQDELRATNDTECSLPTTTCDPSATHQPMSSPRIAHAATPSLPGSPIHIDGNLVNPPHIQKMIVEHVIRSESTPLHSSHHARLRTFSGRAPRPNGEVDYETWRTQADLLITDPSLSNSQKVRKILESLLTPATDVVKTLGIDSLPDAYVAHLDSAFGVVEDGEELFASFLNCNQNNGEKSSSYLNRLHTLLTRAISRGGASLESARKLLLRQFCRGCWDQGLIVSLQLELKKEKPPSFSDLLLMLRTEEDRKTAKYDRMKKHLGATRAAAHAHSVLGMPTCDPEPVLAPQPLQEEKEKSFSRSNKQEEDRGNNNDLAKKIEALTKQVEMLSHHAKVSSQTRDIEHRGYPSASSTQHQRPPMSSGMPRAWFCFRCGEDGHIAARCSNDANPGLVHGKKTELRERQDSFRQHPPRFPSHLNY